MNLLLMIQINKKEYALNCSGWMSMKAGESCIQLDVATHLKDGGDTIFAKILCSSAYIHETEEEWKRDKDLDSIRNLPQHLVDTYTI